MTVLPQLPARIMLKPVSWLPAAGLSRDTGATSKIVVPISDFDTRTQESKVQIEKYLSYYYIYIMPKLALGAHISM